MNVAADDKLHTVNDRKCE